MRGDTPADRDTGSFLIQLNKGTIWSPDGYQDAMAKANDPSQGADRYNHLLGFDIAAIKVPESVADPAKGEVLGFRQTPVLESQELNFVAFGRDNIVDPKPPPPFGYKRVGTAPLTKVTNDAFQGLIVGDISDPDQTHSFAAKGDSGSLVVDEDGRLVGVVSSEQRRTSTIDGVVQPTIKAATRVVNVHAPDIARMLTAQGLDLGKAGDSRPIALATTLDQARDEPVLRTSEGPASGDNPDAADVSQEQKPKPQAAPRGGGTDDGKPRG